MKRIFRILAVLTAACALSSLTPLSAFAEDANGIVVSETALMQGDEFTLSLVVPPTEDADTASVKIRFDASAFEGLEWNPQVSGGFSNLTDGLIALSAANADRYIKLGDGLTLTAKMKVRDDAPDGYYDFVLSENSFCYVMEDGWTFKEVWFPETTSVTVKVGDPAPGASVGAAAENTDQTITEAAPEATQTSTAITQPAADVRPQPQSDGKFVFMVTVIAIIAVVLIAIVLVVIKLIGSVKKK